MQASLLELTAVDPGLRYAAAMLIVGAMMLIISLAVDCYFEDRKRNRLRNWQRKRDGK